jgi:endoglucanase
MKVTLLCLLSLFGLATAAQNYRPVSARIESESYDAAYAVGIENTPDTGGGQNIGWIEEGSWMDYRVAVPVAGYYTFRFRIANGYSPLASLSVLTNGTKLGQITIPQTGGWQSWQTISMILPLDAGNQTLRIFSEKPGFNINWFEVAESRTLAGKIEAESFDAMHEVKNEQTGDEGGGLNVGYIDDGDWMDYNVKVALPGTYTFNIRVAKSYGPGTLELRDVAGNILSQSEIAITGGWQTWTTVSTTAQLSAGSQILRIYAKVGAFNVNWFEAIPPQMPTITGTVLPARIEAENYSAMNNVALEATQDTDGAQNVGWIQDGSWMEYPVHVTEAGFYTFRYRIANAYSPEAKFDLFNSNGQVLGSITVPQTGGWQSWKTVNMICYLPTGNQTLRVFANKGGFNFNWFEALSSRELTARVEAESYDVASDVRTESASDTDTGLYVGYIDDGDFLDFNLKIPTAGTYTLNFRVSNSYGNGKIDVKLNDGSILASLDVPQTGGWQNWVTLRTTAIMPAGSQKIRVFAQRGAFNFNWFALTEGSVLTPSEITFTALSNKSTADEPFELVATTTNLETPVHFTSSDPSILSVSNQTGRWKATIHATGEVSITASQLGNDNYLAAASVERVLVITAGPPTADPEYGTKIPIDAGRWYQLTNAANGLDGFFDGETQVNVHTGWGKVIDYYEAYYPLLEGEEIKLKGIKFFDYTGTTIDQPMVLSVITDQWQRIPVATFTGDVYNGWVGPYPDRHLTGPGQFKLDAEISNARYLVLTIPNTLPTEIEFYGAYTAPTAQQITPRQKNIRLRDLLGVNGYEWNFQDGAYTEKLDETKMTAAKSFAGLRHYMDWEKLEPGEGVYSYNPTLSGSWNYDLIYERCKQAGIEVLACLKTQPNWLQATYPADQRDSENVPVRYGKSFSEPLSYIEQARVAFQYTARYGNNPSVNPELLSVHTTPRWYADTPNTVRIGLNLIRYIECDNERDKWWKGRKGYQTAREYAANMSAFYDGHKNTMGPGVGVKNADPEMKVVIAGLVTGPDYIKGMVDWCKEFRGYRTDGSVDLCWDVVNFHLYNDDTSSNQSGTSTRGVAPEVSNAGQILSDFVKVAREWSQEQPVWITEAGYDISQTSPIKAIPIGNKSALDTQADWLLRSSLFSARHGIEKMFFYQMYDDNGSGGIFGSSGFLNDDQTRRPSADYFLQTNKLFGNYVYMETLHQDPIVDRYELEGKSLYIVVVPSEIGQTKEHTIQLGGAGIAQVYTPKAGSSDMDLLEKPIINGSVSVTASETPIFVRVGSASNARIAVAEPQTGIPDASNSEIMSVYPNPTQDYLNVDLTNLANGEVEVKVFDARMGRLFKNEKISQTGKSLHKKLNISSLPVGTYILEIKQGSGSTFHKFVKAF